MLHLPEFVLTDKFLSTTPNGLLLIFDPAKRSTHLGWIKTAALKEKGIDFQLGLTVTQVHGTTDWKQLDGHIFSVPDLSRYTALDHAGGYFCADKRLTEPTFRVYPAASIPADCIRNHESLVAYGIRLR